MRKLNKLMQEGGISTKNVDKNYIAPKKRLLSRSKSRKVSRASPPRFTPHSKMYSESNLKDALLQKESREMRVARECTFSPNISNPNETVRDADTFYKDQQIHERVKISKIFQLEEEKKLHENATHRPFLSKISEEMALKSRTGQPIHERLHSDAGNNKIKEGVDVLMSIKNSYKKRKNRPDNPRGATIDEYLYNDAFVRNKSRERNCRKSRGEGKSEIRNKNSDKYAMDKLVKEITHYWKMIAKNTGSEEANNEESGETEGFYKERFNLITTALLLTTLGYLSKASQDNDEERNLFYDLWTLLDGEKSNGITFDTAKAILLTIEGFHKGVTMNNDTFEDSSIIYKRIGNIMTPDLSS